MKNSGLEIWDKNASKSLKSYPPNWFSYYVGNSYKIATRIGLKYSISDKICLLKTDLWNESIAYQRDILSEYQKCRNFSLNGIDISRVVCSAARTKIENTNIIQGDIRKLPFKKNSLDIILDLSTLDHIPKNQAVEVIKEYKFILNNKGILILIFWYDSFAVKRIKRMQETDSQYIYSLKSTKDEINKEFDILEEYSTGLLLCIPCLGIILNKMPLKIRNYFLNMAINLEYSNASKFLLKNFGGLYVIVGRAKNE